MVVLSDEMWARIEPVLPPVKGAMGRPMREHRSLVEGVIYRYLTCVAWRDLACDFGPWQTVWKRHYRFSTDGSRGGQPVDFDAAATRIATPSNAPSTI